MTVSTGSPLGATEVHDVWSESVGDTFRIFVGHCGEDPTSTLLLTDANGQFGMAVDSVRLMQFPCLVPSMLVVGIGYPTASTVFDTIDVRARDLTPTHRSVFGSSGGAAAFLRFIISELRPWLADRFPDCHEDVTYFGHSLGGLFGAYVLLHEPDSFERYILSSPSLWWDDEVLFDMEQTRSEVYDDLFADVFFGIGSLETDEGRRQEAANLAADHPAKPPASHLDMVDDMRRFVERLSRRDYSSLRLCVIEIADEYHATVSGAVLNRGLRQALWPKR